MFEGQRAVYTVANVGDGQSFGVEAVYAGNITKWWRVNASLNYYKSMVDASAINDAYSSNFWSWMGRVNSNWTIADGFDLQATGFYRGAMETNQGTMLPMWFVDLGAKKDILQKRASISLRVSDIFKTMKFRMESFGEGVEINHLFERESRQVYLTLSYRLNNYKQQRQNGGGGGLNMDGGGMF
jgi:outer membrane receptor for ferrienterochelin and colicin